MSASDIELILRELGEIKAQVKMTNGRVTRLERIMLIVFGFLVGAGALKLGALSALGL